MRFVQWLVALSFFACCQFTSAATRHVPGDYPTIQTAINASVAGDVVELADGVFSGDENGNIDFHGKAIVVRSSSGNPSACVIDPQGLRRGFYFHSSETAASVVANVGIRAAYGDGAGGILISSSSPTITGCVLSANISSGTFGGAVQLIDSSSRIEDCLIAANSGGSGDGLSAGLSVFSSADVLITGCVIRDHDQGIFVHGGHVSITDCTIVRNRLAGITVHDFYTGPTVVDVDRTIVALSTGPAVRCFGQPILVTASCSDFHGNAGGNWTDCVSGQGSVRGNFSLDPLFCDPVGGDFFLYTYSPCAPPGVTGCGLVGALGVGCGPVSVDGATWGRQKSLFR